ncbi:MAG: TrmH family RNA methyltransferase, partial [Chitinophagaceae bacterium]|nr:TrmH family RNA methyltransferase [Chitinophagaceae bacterium]
MFVKKTMDELERLAVDAVPRADKNPIIIILDDVRSMQNVGAIFRTADAFAVQSIFLCGITPTPPHRDIHKTALGATETVAWQYFDKVTLAIEAAKNQGCDIYSVEQTHNSTALQAMEAKLSQPLALVFGNEVNGVSDIALSLSKSSIEIPQWGSKH